MKAVCEAMNPNYPVLGFIYQMTENCIEELNTSYLMKLDALYVKQRKLLYLLKYTKWGIITFFSDLEFSLKILWILFRGLSVV